MNWLTQVETELARMRQGEHPGRTRTIARRVAGIALQHYYRSPSDDVLRLLQTASGDDTVPNEVRSAVERLSARLDEKFSSPSIDPIGDANIIVNFVRSLPR